MGLINNAKELGDRVDLVLGKLGDTATDARGVMALQTVVLYAIGIAVIAALGFAAQAMRAAKAGQ